MGPVQGGRTFGYPWSLGAQLFHLCAEWGDNVYFAEALVRGWVDVPAVNLDECRTCGRSLSTQGHARGRISAVSDARYPRRVRRQRLQDARSHDRFVLLR